MPKFIINISAEARNDIQDTYRYIAYVVFEPDTAETYQDGILDTINSLADTADIFAISQRDYVQKHWGPDAHTITYKKMTVIYNIIDKVVLVRRVIASRMVL
jgi:plasmid stabilization system protein ParE